MILVKSYMALVLLFSRLKMVEFVYNKCKEREILYLGDGQRWNSQASVVSHTQTHTHIHTHRHFCFKISFLFQYESYFFLISFHLFHNLVIICNKWVQQYLTETHTNYNLTYFCLYLINIII